MGKECLLALMAAALFLPAVAVGQCGRPTYPCAIRDAGVIPLPDPLPDWSAGAGSKFTDPSFNPAHPPQYVRLTDTNSDTNCGGHVANSSMMVDSSGDDAHFNLDDTLIWILDSGGNVFFFGFNSSTMETGCVLFSSFAQGQFSQVNRDYYYNFGHDGELYREDMTSCQLGSGSCSPVTTQLFNYENNCNLNPSLTWEDQGGVGGGDLVFANSYSASIQNTAHQALAYDLSKEMCYEYNTRDGIIRSYVKGAEPVTGTVRCDGKDSVVTWRSGTPFDNTSYGGIGWTQLYVTIGSRVYDVLSVSSPTSLSVNNVCPDGTWNYSINPGKIIGAPTTPDRFTIHNFKVDPSGRYMIIVFNGTCFSQSCTGPYLWQIGTTSVTKCQISCDGHWTEDAYGWINTGTWPDTIPPALSPSYVFRPFDYFGTNNYYSTPNGGGDGATISDDEVTHFGVREAIMNDPFDEHPSNKNDPLGTNNYPIFTNTWAPEAHCASRPQQGCASVPNDTFYCGETSSECRPNGGNDWTNQYGQIEHGYSNEVFAISQRNGTTYRFGHTFHSSLGPPGNSSDLAVGAPSSTGKFYAFTTDGEGTLGNTDGSSSCSIAAGNCRADVFILNLSPP
jgi:hypothetical protein